MAEYAALFALQVAHILKGNEVNEPAFPTVDEVEAAARVLFEAGRHHHWWSTFTDTYDEMAARDAIAKDEFDGIVERVLFAAAKAKLSNRKAP
jgi:hypothetical protein